MGTQESLSLRYRLKLRDVGPPHPSLSDPGRLMRLLCSIVGIPVIDVDGLRAGRPRPLPDALHHNSEAYPSRSSWVRHHDSAIGVWKSALPQHHHAGPVDTHQLLRHLDQLLATGSAVYHWSSRTLHQWRRYRRSPGAVASIYWRIWLRTWCTRGQSLVSNRSCFECVA